MIITLVGGAATLDKSLLAVNLAAHSAHAGRRVLLIDTDPQEYALRWQDQRAAAGLQPGITAYAFTGAGLQQELQRLRLRFEDFIIDCAGDDSQTDRAALIAARLAIIPIDPALLTNERRTQLADRIARVREFNPNLRVLLTEVSSDHVRRAPSGSALRAIAAKLMPCMVHPLMVTHHAALLQAFEQGRSLAEFAGAERQAVEDLHRFSREAFDYAASHFNAGPNRTVPAISKRSNSPHFL